MSSSFDGRTHFHLQVYTCRECAIHSRRFVVAGHWPIQLYTRMLTRQRHFRAFSSLQQTNRSGTVILMRSSVVYNIRKKSLFCRDLSELQQWELFRRSFISSFTWLRIKVSGFNFHKCVGIQEIVKNLADEIFLILRNLLNLWFLLLFPWSFIQNLSVPFATDPKNMTLAFDQCQLFHSSCLLNLNYFVLINR